MRTAIEVFNRFERKYQLDECTARRLQERLRDFMEPDAHNRGGEATTIGSLYYDTADSLLIRRSLARPAYKEKLRLRAYGVPGPDSRVYLEIKKKFRGRTNKRRTALKLAKAYAFLETGRKPALRPSMNPQVLDEIEYFLRVHDVAPRLYVAYDRRAFSSRVYPGLRITFDADIRTRRYDLALERGDHGALLLGPGRVLMEVKTPGNVPLALAHVLAEHRVFGAGFSKYGREYLGLLATGRQAAREAMHA